MWRRLLPAGVGLLQLVLEVMECLIGGVMLRQLHAQPTGFSEAGQYQRGKYFATPAIIAGV